MLQWGSHKTWLLRVLYLPQVYWKERAKPFSAVGCDSFGTGAFRTEEERLESVLAPKSPHSPSPQQTPQLGGQCWYSRASYSLPKGPHTPHEPKTLKMVCFCSVLPQNFYPGREGVLTGLELLEREQRERPTTHIIIPRWRTIAFPEFCMSQVLYCLFHLPLPVFMTYTLSLALLYR